GRAPSAWSFRIPLVRGASSGRVPHSPWSTGDGLTTPKRMIFVTRSRECGRAPESRRAGGRKVLQIGLSTTDTGYVQSETTASPSPARRTMSPLGALQTRLFRADPDAEEGRWIAEMRERRPHRLGARDWQFSFAAATGFVVF